MGKNRRVEKRYIEVRGRSGDLRAKWRVPIPEWNESLRRRLIERVSNRVARLRAGVQIVWENGTHLLRDRERGVEVSIPSTWPTEADAIKDPCYIADPILRQRAILRSYGVERGVWEAA
jgi:hypothetical protein